MTDKTLYVKVKGEDVFLKNGYRGKWRRIRDEAMASTVRTWILDAKSRM